jgi:hypothetical protein
VNPNSIWAVVWHPKGALCVLTLDMVCQFNRLARKRGEAAYMVLDVADCMDQATGRKRELAKEGKNPEGNE